jgi:GNAT superfamily N-acetyltransferase
MLLALAPQGSFAAVHDGRIVGTAIGIDYRGFSWIAMMLVEPAYRGRGLGRRLLEAALESVPTDTPVRLDATPMGRPLYQAYGFEDECAITRWTSDTTDASDAALREDATARVAARRPPLAAPDFARLAGHDRHVFGGDRARGARVGVDRRPRVRARPRAAGR